MILLNRRSTMVVIAVIIGLFFSLLATQTTLADRNQVADMNDRFATEDTGANGFARVRTTQVGSVIVDRVKAKNLLPNTEYQVVATIQYVSTAGGPGDTGFADQVEYSGAVTTDKHGNFLLDDYDVGSLDGPGTYRMDLFVTHFEVSGVGTPGGGANISSVIDRDPLLGCQPTFIFTLE